jgi:hypothetical protein
MNWASMNWISSSMIRGSAMALLRAAAHRRRMAGQLNAL